MKLERIMKYESPYRDLVEQAEIAILIDDQRGRFRYANSKFADIFGYSFGEMLKQSLRTLVHPEDIGTVLKYHRGRIGGRKVPSRYEFRGIRKDGSIIYLEVVASKLKSAAGISGTRSYLWDITSRRLVEDRLNRTLEVLRKTTGTMIRVIENMIEMRDPYTAHHQQRVADLARAIAEELAFPPDTIDGIRIAALIHDIGKISIPTELLTKPTKLTELEFSLLKTHPRAGYELIKSIEFPWPIAQIVLQHHERMDGSGYPSALKSGEILPEARILGVADVVEAMASHRPYRPALGIDAALNELTRNSGVLYDPEIVEACLRVFQKNKFAFRLDATGPGRNVWPLKAWDAPPDKGGWVE
jgi:PAS domain S-box-containing protein/putative nucleotidyltransferase with HDIG domain